MEKFIGLDKVRYLLVDAGVRYYEDATVDGNNDISVYDMYESVDILPRLKHVGFLDGNVSALLY